MKKLAGVAGLLVASIASGNLYASSSQLEGKITKLTGQVQLFTNPGKSPVGPAPHALFEGEYYSVRDAKMGDVVAQGNVLRTAVGGMVKVVHENGDQLNVGPGTAMRVMWDEKKENPPTSMRLLYGKLRGVISKTGPRSGMEVKTATAAMGIRGTDFYIASTGAEEKTQVTILRGSAEVKLAPPAPKPGEPKKAKVEAPKPVVVQAGNTAVVEKAPELPATAGKKAPAAPVVEVHKADKEELKTIEKASVIKKADNEEKAVPKEVAQEIKKLEQKAVETTLQDIKTHDPKLYAQVAKGEVKSTEDLSIKTVEKVSQTAPAAPARRKASRSDLDDLNSDGYDRYFKIVD